MSGAVASLHTGQMQLTTAILRSRRLFTRFLGNGLFHGDMLTSVHGAATSLVALQVELLVDVLFLLPYHQLVRFRLASTTPSLAYFCD